MTALDRFRLDGRTVLLAGGGSGFGPTLAAAFAEAGARVAVLDLDRDAVEETARAARAAGGKVVTRVGDATLRAGADDFVAEIGRTLGPPSILINLVMTANAKGPSQDFDDARFARMLDINVRSYFVMSQAVYPAMQAAGGGAIVNFASISGLVAHREAAAYAASKGAIVQLTRTLAAEWAPKIRVNAVAPSWFWTKGLREAVEGDPAKGLKPSAAGYIEKQLGRVPLGRMGELDEIVGPVLFLASDAASMVTGHILAVDGGLLAE